MRPVADREPDFLQRSSSRSSVILAGTIALAAAFFLGVWVGRYSAKLSGSAEARTQTITSASHPLAANATPSGANRLEEFKSTLGAEAQKLNAEERKPLVAAQEVVARIQPQMAEYEAALNALSEASFVSPGTIKTEEELRARGELVERFQKANEALAVYFQTAEASYRAALDKMGVAEKLKAGAIEGFQRGGNFDLNFKIHEANRRLASSMLEMLKLLSREWGSWRTNDQNEVIFDHEDAVKEFETLQGQLTAAARRHETAEKELIERTAKSRKH
ncbi:MAG TPA: hypothetical protein VFD27_04800 [Chthoniobacteraceae bacterium]|jgi:hypothetical protein|nr:hypothetical protein [Chthoniobacteraceae bacterium]